MYRGLPDVRWQYHNRNWLILALDQFALMSFLLTHAFIRSV